MVIKTGREPAFSHPGASVPGTGRGRVGTMSLDAHLATLQDKHSRLEFVIGEESHRPSPDFGLLQTLKKQKLLLKEEMERLRPTRERLDAA